MKKIFIALTLISTTAYAQLRLVVPRDSSLANFNLKEGELITSEDSKILYIHAANEVTYVSNPPGVILPYAGTVAPAGYLLCDGTPVSRATYSNLYAVIGDAFGKGDGTTTFHTPDLRGRFLRGVDGGADRDLNKGTRDPMHTGGNAGNKVGSVQEDAIKNITGEFSLMGSATENVAGWSGASAIGAFGFDGTSVSTTVGTHVGNTNISFRRTKFDASRQVTTGADNRPKNVYVNYIIKY